MPSEPRRFPAWLRRPWMSGEDAGDVKNLLSDLALHTVCQSAQCPNQAECWRHGTATLMVLGNICTRGCRFCAVNSGRPEAVDLEEPGRVAEAVRRLKLRHVVLTSVTRDDLPDGGAEIVGATVEAVKLAMPDTTVEVLVPDFGGSSASIARVLLAKPDVFGHNIETVERIFPSVRDRRFSYDDSLKALRFAADTSPETRIKSSFMVGLGETEAEVRSCLRDLLAAGCDSVAIGQYLRPTPKHAAVEAYITPETFAAYEAMAYDLGFAFAVAGPFVRSSYRSEAIFETSKDSRLRPRDGAGE
jgi:lipoyl synthase